MTSEQTLKNLANEYRPSMDPEVLKCWAEDASRALKNLVQIFDDWSGSGGPSVPALAESIRRKVLEGITVENL